MTQARIIGNLGDSLSGSSNTNISFDTNTLYIDAVNNRVGFGTTTPTQIVDIVGSANVSSGLSANNINANNVSVSGNTTSGKHIATVYRETLSSPSISSNTLTINCSTGNVFTVNLNSNITTLSFTNVPESNTSYGLVLRFTIGGTHTINWGSSVKWPSNTAPTISSTVGKVDSFVLDTSDGGTIWYGFTSGQNS